VVELPQIEVMIC